jgi:malate synthase
VFDRVLPGANQLDVLRPDVDPNREALLAVPAGRRTTEGLREAIGIGLRYLNEWLSGRGAVPINHQIEDLASAEVCRAQVWQWVRHGARLANGDEVTAAHVLSLVDEERDRITPNPTLAEAARLFGEIVTSQDCEEHFTMSGYRHMTGSGA